MRFNSRPSTPLVHFCALLAKMLMKDILILVRLIYFLGSGIEIRYRGGQRDYYILPIILFFSEIDIQIYIGNIIFLLCNSLKWEFLIYFVSYYLFFENLVCLIVIANCIFSQTTDDGLHLSTPLFRQRYSSSLGKYGAEITYFKQGDERKLLYFGNWSG